MSLRFRRSGSRDDGLAFVLGTSGRARPDAESPTARHRPPGSSPVSIAWWTSPIVISKHLQQALMKRLCLQTLGSVFAAAVSCAWPVGSAHAQFASWASQPDVRPLSGDFDGDGASDLALTGGAGWTSLPVAFSNRDGSFRVVNPFVGDFAMWATAANAKTLVGDFDHDHRSDIALAGGSGWSSIPLATSNGDGTFRVTNAWVGEFGAWAAVPNVDVLAGDFDGDGRTDLALAGGDPSWWHTMPVAFSKKNGAFDISNLDVGLFAVRAGVVGTRKVVGDFDGDGKSDIAVVGSTASGTMPVAFSRGKGRFDVRDAGIGEFAAWAAVPGVKVLVSDFNGDKRSDIALIGGDPNWWSTVPVAFSKGDGTFTVTNFPAYFDGGNLSALAAHGAATVFAGDANGDGLADITVVSAGTFVYTGLSRGDGHFGVVISQPGDFAPRSHEAGVRAVTGDFNRDGRIDVALTGNPFWNTVPVARSKGGSYIGSFRAIQEGGVQDIFPVRAWVTGSTWEPFANRCAADPVGSLRTLQADPGYVMGYRSGSDSASAWAPTTGSGMEHRQGIQRLNRNGQNYFAVSMSTQPGTPAGLEITALGSRGPTLFAMGGNILPFQLAPEGDAVRAYLGESSTRNHASGFQITGEYAIQPLEAVNDSVTAGFRIVRLSDPTRPVWSASTERVRSHTTDAGAAALVRLQSGRFMALVFGNNSDNVEVFVSSLADMPGFNDSASQWQSMAAADTPFGASWYQNIQIVSDCGGQFYIVGTHRHWDSENDWADIWRLDVADNYAPSFAKLGNFNAKCRTGNTGNERYCDFSAGAGTYVDGSGKLVLYGVEHYNDGLPGTTRMVKVREFN
jgi:hypothetical protein